MEGLALKNRREAINKSLNDVAHLFGVSALEIELWEDGKAEIPYSEIVDLAMQKLEEDYHYETVEAPLLEGMYDKVAQAIHRTDAVLAGVD